MLTARQERFCKEYIIDCNATQAYIRAGYSTGNANALASRMLAKDSIRARIAELMAEKDAALVATADEVLKTLTRILRREETEQVVVTLSERAPTVNAETGRASCVTREQAKLVEVKPKLSDVNRAAELLGKRYGLYTENVNMSALLPVIVDDIPCDWENGGPPG